MAEPRGIRRWIQLILDPAAALRMEKDAEASLKKAGAFGSSAFQKELAAGGSKAIKALTTALKTDFERTMSDARLRLGKGLIDEREFRRIRNEAHATFNGRLIPAMERLQREGKLTESQFAQLSRQIKNTGDTGDREMRRVERGVDGVGRSMDGLRSMARRALASMAALFALDRIRQFGATSIREAAASEEAWSSLGGTVQATGGNWAEVEQRTRAAAQAFQDVVRVYDDDQYAVALQRLTALTGNHTKAVGNMGLVANVAARYFKGELEPAVELVGKALNGQTRVLRQVGIVTKDASEGLRTLAQRSMGAAEERARTFNGRLAALNAEWGNFKEAVGFAMIAAGGGTSVLDTLSGVVRGATKWVEENETTIASWGRGFVRFIGTLAGGVRDALVWWGRFRDGVMLVDAAFSTSMGHIGLWAAQFANAVAQGLATAARRIADFAGFVGRLPGPLQAMLGFGGMVLSGLSEWADALAANTARGVDAARAQLLRLQATQREIQEDVNRRANATPAPRQRTSTASGGGVVDGSGDIGDASSAASARQRDNTAAQRAADAAAEARREAELLARVWSGPLTTAPERVRELLEGVLRVEKEIRDTERERAEAQKAGADVGGLNTRLANLRAERQEAERLLTTLAPLAAAYEATMDAAALDRAAGRKTAEQAEAIGREAGLAFNQGLTAAIHQLEAQGLLTPELGRALAEEMKSISAPPAQEDNSLHAQIELLGRAAGLRRLNADEVQRARELESTILTQLEDQNLSLEGRLALEEQLSSVREAMASIPSLAGLMESGFNSAMGGMADAAGEFFAAFLSGNESLKGSLQGLGLALVENLSAGLAEYAVAKGTLQLAEGTWPPNPAALLAASRYFLAAGLFRALPALIAGGGGGGGGSGGMATAPGNDVRAPRDAGLNIVRDAQTKAADVHVYIDPLDPTNPAYALNAASAVRYGQQLVGPNARVHIHRRT